jgi:hypothetical protein
MSKRAAEAGGAAQKNAAAREAFGEGGGGDEGAVIDPNTGAVNSDRFAPSVNQPLNLGNAFAADDSKKP